MTIRSIGCFFLGIIASLQLNASTSHNLGYTVEVESHRFSHTFAGEEAPSGFQWCVLEVSFTNTIDPFLVFDYDVEETINILSLQDRMFLVSDRGDNYRLNSDFFGQNGHLKESLKLESAGAVVRGLAVFRIAADASENLELHVIDETFASVTVPVVGKVAETLLPEGLSPESNKGVTLAVGDHGPFQVSGVEAREGRKFYFVDLWGKSNYSQTVKAYFVEEGADMDSTAETGFFFEYKRSDLVLKLVVDDGYAFSYVQELSLGVAVHPTYLPEKWTKSRLVFEIPQDAQKIQLDALFGKMGLSTGSQTYYKGLTFPLLDAPVTPKSTAERLMLVDTQKPNELTVSLALVPDQSTSQWGVDSETWVALWVSFENTGAEPGALDPLSRLWFEGGKMKRFADKTQPGNPWAPPPMLFLAPGHPRSYLMLFSREALQGVEGLKLSYSGIGRNDEMVVDLDASKLTLLEQETFAPVGDQKEFNLATKTETEVVTQGGDSDTKTNSNASTALLLKPTQQKGGTHPQTQNQVESEPIVPEIKLEPYIAEYPPAPYHEPETANALIQLAQMEKAGFLELSDEGFGSFTNSNGAVSGAETEPNDEWDQASPMEMDKTYSAVIESKGEDHWKITVPPTASADELRQDLLVSFPTDMDTFKGLYCTLLDKDGNTLVHSWMEKVGSYPFRNLKLAPGDYVIRIQNYGDQPDAPYFLQLKSRTYPFVVEVEPNAWKTDFLELEEGIPVHGVIGNRDPEDFYTWQVSKEDSSKRFDILVLTDQPEQEMRMFVYDSEGNEVYWKNAKDRFSMADFSPVPGTYYVKIYSRYDEPTRYQLQLEQRGQWTAGWEREPNDEIFSNNLVVIKTLDDSKPELLGRLEGYYGDFFAIEVKDTNSLYHVTVSGPDRVDLSYHDFRRGKIASAYGRNGDPAFFVDLRLPSGLNYFAITGAQGDYAVNVQQVPIPGETFEWEPNDTEGQAKRMQAGVAYQGRLLSNHDDDWFRLVVHQAMKYRFRLDAPEGSKLNFQVYSKGAPNIRQHTTEGDLIAESEVYLLPGDYRVKIEAGEPSEEFYSFRVDPVPAPEGMVMGDIVGLEAEILNPFLVGSAFNDDFQQIETSAKLVNHGDSVLRLTLLTQSTHWKVKAMDIGPTVIELQPGQSKVMEIPWVFQPQLAANEDIQVFIGFEAEGVVEYTSATIDLSPEVVDVKILPGRQLFDPALAGGMNLNAKAFGAVPMREPESLYGGNKVPSEDYLKYLMDGVLANRSFWGQAAVIQMVGEGKTPIVGTSIDLHGRGNLWESAKDFSIDVSDDGQSFREVFSGTLTPRTGDQFFVFPKPVTGKFARLRLHNTQSGTEGQLPHLGEWRMIATPTAPVAGMESVDLLKKENGGHWINGDKQSRVYGFQHNRAARFNTLVWTNKKKSSGYWGNVHELKVEISEDSPVGPWTVLGSFDVSAADQEAGENLSVSLPIEGSPLARFVKFSWGVPEHATSSQQPESIRLIEVSSGQDYRSAVGEWQGPTQFAYPEFLEKQAGGKEAVELKRIQSAQNSPYRLEPEKWVNSVAWINNGWEDWFEIDAVKAKKQLQFTVEAKPFVKVAVDILDEQGKSVKVNENTMGAYRKEFTFLADAGVKYRVHVYEPKRSIVYLWDVSGSMGAFVESIENAVLKFGEEIDPGSEKVQLLPFDEPPEFLLDDWASDSFTLQTTVRNYVAPSSSYAHLNLLTATEMLADQQGTKAAIVITDCESPRNVNNKLWEALGNVKPAVFTFQTSDQTNGYAIEQDDMQDWAAVAGGFYHNTRATEELDTAFEKVQAYLRRPAPYRIHLTAPELKPSFIAVKDAREKSTIRNPEQDGVLLIIDASASMRENLPDGQMKVSAAKAVINDLVANYLPKGVNFGLRVFGHRGGGNCVSELMMPVAPLDPATVQQKLMFVRSSSLGNTALAEALSFAAEDLKNLAGLKRVVVLTDGEETCHGDPAAEIAKLADAGLEVKVNIVGFTLGDEQVKADYANWVQSTGGKYFDAQDLNALGTALQEAMTPVELPMYEIYDSAGALVKTGQVGDGQTEVESGAYTVKILDPDNPWTEEVEAFETTVTIDYK